MKKLALLSVFLALPLAAQTSIQVPKESELDPAVCEHIEGCKEAAQKQKQTALSADEHDQLALLLMQAQSARIVLLEKLASSQAGNAEILESDKAAQAYSAKLTEFAKKHSAESCNWNFPQKQWVCPPKQGSPK